MLGIMGISGFFGRLNISQLSISLNFPEEIYAKKAFPLKVTVKNGKNLPSLAVGVEVEGKRKSIPVIEGKGKREAVLELTAPSRGRHRIKEIRIFSPFPFAFFVRSYTVKTDRDFLVFPQPIKCPHISEEAEKAGDSQLPTAKGLEGELVNIREYHPSDPLKLIHWKASAKKGKLLVKEFSRNASEAVLIDFDEINLPLEERLSCIAYLIQCAYSRKIPFGLKIKDRLFPPETGKAHKLRLLRELALFNPER
ncbi:MAG: DUF58 domain-containing protein [Deferribacteres bacterium]|nr:DUF58 domain-containing protein [Deferribacteres bacterium]